MYANPAVNPYSFVDVDVAIAIADAATPVKTEAANPIG
jgi:hypothetical protein